MTTKTDRTKAEHELLTGWILSITLPPPPTVQIEENKAIVEAVQKRFNAMVKNAAKENNLPF